jgi:hypothetical protein
LASGFPDKLQAERTVKRVRTPIATVVILVLLVVAGALLAKHAFGPPVPPEKLASIREGMSEEDVRGILGKPTKIISGGHAYTLNGTNYVTCGQ